MSKKFMVPITLLFTVLFFVGCTFSTSPQGDLSYYSTTEEFFTGDLPYLREHLIHTVPEETTTEIDETVVTTTELTTEKSTTESTTQESTTYIEKESTTFSTTYVESTTQPSGRYSESDLDLLARLIYAEGGTTSYGTQMKIGSVVLNRVNRPEFKNSIYSVIYESGQFTVASGSNPSINKRPSQTSINAARELLTCGSVLPIDVVYFYESYVQDQWINTRAVYGIFDGVVFAYVYAA